MIFFIISFAGGSSPSLLASSLTSLPFGLLWLASFRSGTSASDTLYLLDSCKLRFWRESGTNNYLPSARDRFRRGRIPLRCARYVTMYPTI